MSRASVAAFAVSPAAPPVAPKVARERSVSNKSGIWTDERIEGLKTHWANNLSCSQIADELGDGITRNAVIGKVHRLGLSRIKPADTPSRRRAPCKVTTPKPPQPFSFKKGPPMIPVPFSPTPAIVTPICEPVTIMGLNEHTCHWPISDDPRMPTDEFMYCGALPIGIGESYCQFHHQLAYVGVPPRKFTEPRPR